MFSEYVYYVFNPKNRIRKYATPLDTPIQFETINGILQIVNSDTRLTGAYSIDYLERLIENGELIRYEKKKSNFNLE